MKYARYSSGSRIFKLQVVRDGVVYAEWETRVDNSGLAALLRTVDKATTEAQALRSIGLRKKRRKKRSPKKAGREVGCLVERV